MDDLEVVTLGSTSPDGGRAHEAVLDEFHRGIYWDAFAAQHEPLAVWKRALWGGEAAYASEPRGEPVPSGYDLTIRIAGRALDDPARRELLGGIAYERYRRCACGLITYMVIAPPARRRGLGRRLQGEAARSLFAAGAPAVFGEVNDPRRRGAGVDEPAADMWRRLERNQAWGARVVDAPYVQPALAPGLARDHGLCLIALAGGEPLPAHMPGAIVRAFITELYELTEGHAADPALLAAIPERVALIELRR